jgi:hypothetical protein
MVNVKKVAIFVGGMLFGSAGFKILASKDAKKVYTQTTAAVLRMKDCTMETVSRSGRGWRHSGRCKGHQRSPRSRS